GLVAIGERKIAAACGQLQRQSAADAAGGAGHGGRASGYRSHWVGSMQVLKTDVEKKAVGFPDFRKLEPNHKALSSLNLGYFGRNDSSIDATTPRRLSMGQSKPFRATALIVEDDPMQREMLCLLLEESEVDVIECESAEAAKLVLERAG